MHLLYELMLISFPLPINNEKTIEKMFFDRYLLICIQLLKHQINTMFRLKFYCRIFGLEMGACKRTATKNGSNRERDRE